MAENMSCSVCKEHRAEVFCVCSDLPLLCGSCRSVHEAKPDFHFSISTSAYGFVNRGNQVECKVWLIRLKNSQEKLRENLKALDQCRADIEAQALNIQRELVEMTTQALQTLELLKQVLGSEIEQAVLETTANACRRDYQPQTYLAGLIWTDSNFPRPDPLQVFGYTLQTGVTVKDCLGVSFRTSVPHLERLNWLTDAEIKAKLAEQTKGSQVAGQLVHLAAGSLRYFDFQTRVWQTEVKLEERMQAFEGSTWVVLEDGRVFVNDFLYAYVLSSAGAKVSKSDMRTDFRYRGVISRKQAVFLFGGKH